MIPGFEKPSYATFLGGTTFIFDESTNSALAADVVANQSLYKVVAGALQKNGVTQSVAAASATFTALLSATVNITEAQFDNVMNLLNSGTATLAQVNTILFNVLLKLRKLGHI